MAKYRKQWDEARKDPPEELDVPDEPSEADMEALRMIDAEALAFKMFKNIVAEVVPLDIRPMLGQQFTEIFGAGSFGRVMGQSTLMAVKDYLTLVRPWHELPARQFQSDTTANVRIGDLPPVKRRDLAAGVLSKLLRNALGTARERGLELPSDTIIASWATNLVRDLVLEGVPPSRAAVAEILEGYVAIKARGSHPVQCVHCAVFIDTGEVEETSEALGTQTSFSNRGLAFGPEASPPACQTCTTDLWFGQLLLGRNRGDSRKRVAKDLATALDEVLPTDDLDQIGKDLAVSPFDSKMLAGMLVDGKVSADVRERPGVARAIASAAKESMVEFALPTPNLVIVSLDRPLGGKDVKDVDRALYSFALATLFALELEVAAMVAPLSELRSGMASRSAGSVYVPANGPARSLLGGDWLPLGEARRWLRAIQASGALKERAKANSLYEVMRYPSAGFLVRRLEQNAGDRRVWWPDLWPRIEAMKEVLE